MALNIYLIAAEASGDALAGDVMDAIRHHRSDIEFQGVGGPQMHARGVTSLFDIGGLSVLGLVEGLKAYGLVKQRVEEVAQDIVEKNPHAIVLIDSWGFMWRVAKRARELGYKGPRIKLVGPQVWATRPGRAKVLARHVDHLLCIHGFEVPFYEPYDLPVTVIGNPALSRMGSADGSGFRARHDIDPDALTIGLLPGSRRSELKNVAPVLASAAIEIMASDRVQNSHLICVAAESVTEPVREMSETWPGPFTLSTDPDEKSDAFAAMDVVLACSGTVTTEVAMQGAPLVVGYKIGWATWAIARAFLMKSRYICLINVAANKEIAPEFVQTRFTVERVKEAGLKLATDESLRQQQIQAQYEALDSMGRNAEPAAEIAANTILDLAGREHQKRTPLGVLSDVSE